MPIFSQLHRHFTQGVPSAERERMEFVPDAIPYGHTQEEYAQAWERLSDPKAGAYFYTNGFVVRRAGRLRNAWESVRGAFGFTNRCNPERAQMTLQKLAYYGYLKNYDQSPLTQFQSQASEPYRLPNDFFRAIREPSRGDAKSLGLQELLVSFYRTHQEKLRPNARHKKVSTDVLNFRDVTPDWKFGETLLDENNKHLVDLIKLDPQDDTVIQKLVPQINGQPLPENALQVGSKLREAYITHILQAYSDSKIKSADLAERLARLKYQLNPTDPKTIDEFAERMARDPGLEGAVEKESLLWNATLDKLLEELLANHLTLSEFNNRLNLLNGPSERAALWKRYLNQHLGASEPPAVPLLPTDQFVERLAKLNRLFQPTQAQTVKFFAARIDPKGPIWPAFINKLSNDFLDGHLSPESFIGWLEGLNATINVTDPKKILALIDRVEHSPALLERLEKNSPAASAYADRVIAEYKHSSQTSWLGAMFGSQPKIPTAKIYQAAKLDTAAEVRHQEFFIQFYISQKDYANAARVIAMMKDVKLAVDLFREHYIKVDLLEQFIKKDSPLGLALADALIEDITAQNMSLEDSLATAEAFVSKSLLEKKYPAHYLKLLVKTNQIDEAYQFYETVKDKSNFVQSDLDKMAALFHQRGEASHRISKTHRHEQKWEAAEKAMEESAHAKKVAYLVAPKGAPPQGPTYKTQSDLRSYHVGKLIARSPLYPEKRAERLEKAIHKLRATYQKDESNPRTKKTLIAVLEQRGDLAVKACLCDMELHHGAFADPDHANEVMEHVKKAIECFSEITRLNPKGEHPLQTAKAHFMLAELETYFRIKKNVDDYRRAAELMPMNPFYLLRYANVLEVEDKKQELRDKGYGLITQYGLGDTDYDNWLLERWERPGKHGSRIVDCHQFNKEAQGWSWPKLW